MTLFATDLDQTKTRRIWDVFLVFGDRIIHQVGLALLYRAQEALLALSKQQSTEHVLRFLKVFTRENLIKVGE